MRLLAPVEAVLRRWMPGSLTNRVFAIYGVTLVVFFSGGLALFLAAQYEELVEERQQSAVMIIELAAQTVRDSAVIGDYDTLRRTLDLAVQGSVFGSAAFIDSSGGRVEASNLETPNVQAPEWFLRWVSSKFYDANLTVSVGGKDYGVLRLRFDAAYAAGDLWSLTRLAFLGALASLILGLVPIHLLLRRWLGGLDRLRDYEVAMAQGRLDERRLQIKGAPEEIQRVIEMFLRTAELVREREASRRALDNQKFALDQHAIVSITDLDGNITYANDRFCEITGYSRAELMGSNHRIINSGNQDRAFFENLWRTISSGRVWRGEICNRKRNGDLYWVDATIVPLAGDDGRPEQYIAIRTDISYRKGIEASLQAAKEVAESANRAKSQFLANVSHEIRTPLNAVLGMLKLLQSTAMTARQGDYVNKIEGAARSLMLLLNDVLDFSKAEADKMTLDPRPFRMDQVLRDLSVILSASIAAKPIEVLFDIDPHLPRRLVGDDLRLQQVLINLGGNAVKFTDSGEVVIQVRVLEWGETDVLLKFAVHDTGIGIPQAQQKHIFEGFSQAEASTTRRFGGTGLGLAICQRLVGLMGGRIEVLSEPGKGSVFSFRIRLPLVDKAEPQADAGRSEKLPELSGLRALVVDDNEVARDLLASMVRSLGWQVDVAESGPKAVEMAREAMDKGSPFDVAFVDWQMPGMDGWETSLRLRGATRGGATVMMVTAHGREMLAQRSATEQASLGGFLVKPVTASMMFDAVADARMATPMHEWMQPIAAAAPRRLQGMRLLVVEDNPNNQQVAQELLQAEGAMVWLADNGQKGVEAVRQAQPAFDAVLMDLQMPVMDGFTATAAIRAQPASRTLPIIAMTANAMASDRQACIDAGMNDHVGKPFDIGDLVRTLLSHTRPGEQVHAPAVSTPASPFLSASLVDQARECGVDLAAAVGRLGSRVDVYARSLRNFLRDLPEATGRMQALVERGSWADAARELHTLKGLAGMLGASAMQTFCRTAEAEFRAGPQADHARSRLAELLALAVSLELACVPLVESLEQQIDSHLVGSSLSAKEVQTVLGELRTRLLQSDMGAIDIYDRIRGALGAWPAAVVASLEQAMSALDFEAAAQACDRLLDRAGP